MIVNKSVLIQGEHVDNTIIDAINDNWGIYIGPTSCDVTDTFQVDISGFTIQHTESPYCGIMVRSSNTGIQNCKIKNHNHAGIHIQRNNNFIISNEFFHNGVGIVIEDVDTDGNYNYIDSNNFIDSNCGLWVSSDENTIINNIFLNCGIDYSSTSENNTITNNTINNKPLVYLNNKNNLTLENAGQIILERCEHITIKNNDLTNASIGIQLVYSNNCIIQSNDVSNNFYGVRLLYSHQNFLSDNKMNHLRWIGIYAYVSHFNMIINNTINNFRDIGINLYYSWVNTVQNNDISSFSDGDGICIWYSNDNKIIDNTISLCRDGIYQHGRCKFTDIINNTISSCNYSGINVWNCSYYTFEQNILFNNKNGIDISDSDNISIVNNYISDNQWGIQCDRTLDYTVLNNIISNNSHVGFLSYNSEGLIKSNIFDNNWAATFIAALDNEIIITENNFIGHNPNLHFVKSNTNPHAIKWGGNYWENWQLNLPKPILGMRFLPIRIAVPLPSIMFDMNPAKEPFDIEVNN